MTTEEARADFGMMRNVTALNRLASSYLLFGQLTKAKSIVKLSLFLSEDNHNALQLLAVIEQRITTVSH